MCSCRNAMYLCLSTYVNTVRYQVLLLSSSSMILLTIIYVCDWVCEKGLIHASNSSNLRMCNSASIGPTLWNLVAELSYHYTNKTKNFILIACLEIKLCLVKVGKSDACIRPLFANLVTYVYRSFIIIFTFTVLWCISS